MTIPLLVNSDVITTGELGTNIHILRNFLSLTECQALIEEATPFLENSRVGALEVNLEERSSFTAMMKKGASTLSSDIERRLEQLSGFSSYANDVLQVNRYNVGEHFSPHHDYHDPETRAEIIAERGQRTWTFIVYLNDGYTGGFTRFPELGIEVVPEPGMLVAWNNLNSDGTCNPRTLHESPAIISGTKWLVTKWFRDKLKL